MANGETTLDTLMAGPVIGEYASDALALAVHRPGSVLAGVLRSTAFCLANFVCDDIAILRQNVCVLFRVVAVGQQCDANAPLALRHHAAHEQCFVFAL